MKTLIVIFAIFVILSFITSGYEVAISNIKSLLSGIWQILRFMAEMALRFPDELGLLDAAYTWILYLILCVLFCCLGIHMSKREKRQALYDNQFRYINIIVVYIDSWYGQIGELYGKLQYNFAKP